jgi:hypothetical protein
MNSASAFPTWPRSGPTRQSTSGITTQCAPASGSLLIVSRIRAIISGARPVAALCSAAIAALS